MMFRNRYMRKPLKADPVGDTLQRKINKMYNELPNVAGNADDNLVVGYSKEGTTHNTIQCTLPDLKIKYSPV